MTNFSTLQEVEAELLAHAPNRLSGADYKIERIGALMAHIGNPQNDLRVVHITGTSGKTSTAYYVRALLEAAGAKTGLTVSPHIESTTERIQIGGKPLAEQRFVEYFQEFFPLAADFAPRPTYFELLTAFAYWVFKKEAVDYAVVEVGLGGRYDATNTVSRDDKVCIINSIGYDHTEIFGSTLTAIAGEKSGIITEKNAVFTVPQDEEAQVVITAEVVKKQAKLEVVRPDVDPRSQVPPFQQQNFALARAAVEYIAHRDGLTLPPDLTHILHTVSVPGRFEVYMVGKKTVILDGAHNPQKLAALLEALAGKNMRPAVAVAGFSEAPEEKITECIRLLSSVTERTFYTTFTVQRDVLRHSVGLETLARLGGQRDSYIEEAVAAWQAALAAHEPYIIVTGSLYLVSILRPFVQHQASLPD